MATAPGSQPPAAAPRIDVVVPIFNEEEVLPRLLQRLLAVFDAHPRWRWRAILVDDGSRDGSVALMARAAAADERIRLVRLSRNFGFQAALLAGMQVADGDAVATMDGDLQDPPELLPEMVRAWEGGAEVVRAVRRSRQERGWRRLAFAGFHRLIQALSHFPLERNTGTFGLLDRSACRALAALPERDRFFPGLRAWIGFQAAEVVYDRQLRAAGQPGQDLRKLIRYALDGILGFSHFPLRVLTACGLGVSGGGFALGAFFTAKRLLGLETAGTGFTTLVTLLVFLGGVQLIAIGVLGEYLGRIYEELKGRPSYLLHRRQEYFPTPSSHEPGRGPAA